MTENPALSRRYFTRIAAAYTRGTRPDLARASDVETVAGALASDLRIHRYKRTRGLRRVDRVLGVLRGLEPARILDVGSGRGVFLWPLLEAFPAVPVTAIDRSTGHAAEIAAVARGGIRTLSVLRADAGALPFPDRAFDAVTALEIMEHIARPEPAAREIVRVARRFVVVSVPSRPDDNPEHLRLFTKASLESLWLGAGARKVGIESVLNHHVAVVRVT
jgi:ubiquinone/menaquinone biosynthesis C-methylase UbiE